MQLRPLHSDLGRFAGRKRLWILPSSQWLLQYLELLVPIGGGITIDFDRDQLGAVGTWICGRQRQHAGCSGICPFLTVAPHPVPPRKATDHTPGNAPGFTGAGASSMTLPDGAWESWMMQQPMAQSVTVVQPHQSMQGQPPTMVVQHRRCKLSLQLCKLSIQRCKLSHNS